MPAAVSLEEAKLRLSRIGKTAGDVALELGVSKGVVRGVLEARTPIAVNDTTPVSAAVWARYNEQPEAVKAKAKLRAAILVEVEALVDAGTGKTAATATVAERHGISPRAIAGWFAAVTGIASHERLPMLAPKHGGGARKVEIDDGALHFLKSDYLRLEKPAFAACYNRLVEEYAGPRGILLPDPTTMKRRLMRAIKAPEKKKLRDGSEALRRMVPPQKRSVANLQALEAVNVDGHKFDVFVRWEDGRIGRPIMVGIQDVYSRKLLAHRIGETENTPLARGAFADLFQQFGIPAHAVLDNGRAFASKALTGGAPTRFRFKVKSTDPTGMLIALGIKTHWTLPYRGSSKPIERAWRDLCEVISKHPKVAGAYTGNKPDAKPENYGEWAIPIAEFRKHVANQIALHNARAGRDTEMADGRSFDDVFAASIAAGAIIRRANEHQLRLAMLEAAELRCSPQTGAVSIEKNVYWSEDMTDLAGEKVIVRFNPDNLHEAVHIYPLKGGYVGPVELYAASDFFDKSAADRRRKAEQSLNRRTRALEQERALYGREELTRLLSDPTTPAPMPEPVVVRPVRHRGNTAAALKPIPQAGPAAPAVPDFTDHFLAAVDRRLRVIE